MLQRRVRSTACGVRSERRSPFNPQSAIRNPQSGGFTLVEVLAALAVLIIGMSAILGVLYAAYQNSHTAADRDAAGILIPAAIRDIAQQQYVYATGTYTEVATPALFPDASSPLLSKYQQAGVLYRMRYRLEAHAVLPEYKADYEGLCVLTVVCYRDSKKDASELVQIADPVTVYLRKR